MLKYALTASGDTQYYLINNSGTTWFKSVVCLFISLFVYTVNLKAEGSKELNENGGQRAYLLSSNYPTASNPFYTPGTMKVFAKAGETLYLGSSAQGIGGGRINVRSPNGATVASSTLLSNTGKIQNRTQEINGPRLVAGDNTRYLPFIVSVTQTGVYEVDFISPVIGANVDPAQINSADDWTQKTNSQFIAAFDVSVRNIANTAFVKGRAFCNIFGGNLGSGSAKFNAVFKVLTKDGYIYDVKTNGQTGWGFAFFVNNKGFRNTAGSASYQSIPTSAAIPPVHDPRANDGGSDITHKIFFNEPANDLPSSDPISGTWLKIEPVSPLPSNFVISGVEGTLGKAGTFPLGCDLTFKSNIISEYTITLDLNGNNSFNDAVDRTFSGTAIVGSNTIHWDGLNGLGNAISGNFVLGASNIELVLKGGEVHFPLIDVENNPDGLIITRTNGLNTNDIVYWNDSNIGGSNYSVNGVKSSVNGHKWTSSFGDNKGIDTWAYILSAPIASANTVEFRQANLQVVDVTPLKGIFCMGADEGFKVTVKNNGPSAVTGAQFNFTFPAQFNNVNVSGVTTGIAVINSGSVAGNAYNASLNMANGSSVTFTILGTVASMPSTYFLEIETSITRPADVTDPDATNPDSALPVNAQIECDADPSGAGCNNLVLLGTTPVQKVPVPVVSVIN